MVDNMRMQAPDHDGGQGRLVADNVSANLCKSLVQNFRDIGYRLGVRRVIILDFCPRLRLGLRPPNRII
jgi:hypothetical protein